LRDNILVPRTERGQNTHVPLALYIGGEATVRQIDEHEPMFLLLLQEARAMKISVPQRELEMLLPELHVRLEDGTIRLANPENLGEERTEIAAQAVRDYLQICAARDLAASVVKVSQPLLKNRLAKEEQEIKLNLIEFDTKDFLPKVPAPSQEALQKQF